MFSQYHNDYLYASGPNVGADSFQAEMISGLNVGADSFRALMISFRARTISDQNASQIGLEYNTRSIVLIPARFTLLKKETAELFAFFWLFSLLSHFSYPYLRNAVLMESVKKYTLLINVVGLEEVIQVLVLFIEEGEISLIQKRKRYFMLSQEQILHY